jgi:hypothetical protein
MQVRDSRSATQIGSPWAPWKSPYGAPSARGFREIESLAGGSRWRPKRWTPSGTPPIVERREGDP